MPSAKTKLSDSRNNQVIAIVPAGGSGQRMGAVIPKQYLPLIKSSRHQASVTKSVIEVTLDNLIGATAVDQIIVVIAETDQMGRGLLQAYRSQLTPENAHRLHVVPRGGATRSASVLAGCQHAAELWQSSNGWLLVHDAARPGAGAIVIQNFIEVLQADSETDSHLKVGGLLALRVADTIKQSSGAHHLSTKTIDRSNLWHAQTPQMFRADVLLTALQTFTEATDEASAIEAAGYQPRLIEGPRCNFKITTAEDLAMMSLQLAAQASPSVNIDPMPSKPPLPPFRIGQGYDSHALVPGRKLILGGVQIACERGLLGHSDADALLHATIDALLGAIGAGDIGRLFPDTAAEFEGADSAILLANVYEKVKAAGWQLGNLDATIIAQSPKLQQHIPLMVSRIAKVLNCDESQVNVKAKTNEKLGHLGRGEAIGVHAVACVVPATPSAT